MTAQTISGVGPEIATRLALEPAARAVGAFNGVAIDRLGFNSCAVAAIVGAVTGAPSAQTLDVKLQHSDTSGGTYVDFTPSIPQPTPTGAVSQITAVSSAKKRSIDLKTAKRWIRVVATHGFTGGTSPTLNSAVVVVLGGSDTLPIADD